MVRRTAVKFGMMTYFDPLAPSDGQNFDSKTRWRTADVWPSPRSIYSKRFSRGQNRYGENADGVYISETCRTIEPSVCCGDAVLCQITLTAYCLWRPRDRVSE